MAFKKSLFLCLMLLLGASQAFAFTALNGEVSFDRLLYGGYYDYPGKENTGVAFVPNWSNGRISWDISGKTNLIQQYSLTLQCAPVADYPKAQSKYYTYTFSGQQDYAEWEQDPEPYNYTGAPKNCFCKASIIAQGQIDPLYGEPKPLAEAVTKWFKVCEPEIIKPWIELLPAEKQSDGTIFKAQLLSKGNDTKEPQMLFKIFPRNILFEETEKNLIILKPNNPNAFSAWENGRWLLYYDSDDQATRPMFAMLLKNLYFVNKDYCYQASASNSRGTTVSPAMCFGDEGKVIGFPRVANKSAIPGTNNTAFITGLLTNTGGSPELYFWVLAEDYYDPKTPKRTVSSGTDFKVTKAGSYQFKVEGFEPDTTYCYFTTARNEAGFASTKNNSALDCFVTPGISWVKTLPSTYTEVQPSYGQVNAKFFATIYSLGAGKKNLNLSGKGWFEYDLKANFPKDISKIDLPKITKKISFTFNPFTESKGKNFSASMPETLLAGKEYCYRAVVENSLGIKKKGNLECFSYGGQEAVASVPEGIKFVLTPDGANIQKVVLKGAIVFPKNVEVAYFIWQKGIQGQDHKTTYKTGSNWTATVKNPPPNGNWANASNTFYGEILNPVPGDKYCYKAVSHYNQNWMTAYYPLDENHLHCFVIPFRPQVETFDADLGADLSIVKLQGKIKDAGFNNFWTDDGKYNIGQLLYEKQIILERKEKNALLSTDSARLTQINGILDGFTKQYCQGITCGTDVYFNVYPENISAGSWQKDLEKLAQEKQRLSQFGTETVVHNNLEYFSYQVANGTFKSMLAPAGIPRCVRYECGFKNSCQQVVYAGADCARLGRTSCRWEGQYCQANRTTDGVYCEWTGYNPDKEKCELYQITFPKGSTCPTSEDRCLGISYSYKARAKNVAWYDNTSNAKKFLIATEPIPYGQSIAFWDQCQRSNSGLTTMRRSGCADTSMTMAIAYWYKNDSSVKAGWNRLINKYYSQIREWEDQQGAGCKNPGLDYNTPNPFTFLYIARNAHDTEGTYAYGAIAQGGQWIAEGMTKLLKDINIIPEYLTGSNQSVDRGYLSFERAVQNLSNGKVIVIRRPTATVGGTGHWLYFNMYDPNTKTINGIDSWDGSYVSYTKDDYKNIGFGYEFSSSQDDDEVDNWALEPDHYPALEAVNQVNLVSYDSEQDLANLKFLTTVKKTGANNDEIEIKFYWQPVSINTGLAVLNLDNFVYPKDTPWQKYTVKSEVGIIQNVNNVKINPKYAYCYWAVGKNNLGYMSGATQQTCFTIKEGKIETVVFPGSGAN